MRNSGLVSKIRTFWRPKFDFYRWYVLVWWSTFREHCREKKLSLWKVWVHYTQCQIKIVVLRKLNVCATVFTRVSFKTDAKMSATTGNLMKRKQRSKRKEEERRSKEAKKVKLLKTERARIEKRDKRKREGLRQAERRQRNWGRLPTAPSNHITLDC